MGQEVQAKPQFTTVIRPCGWNSTEGDAAVLLVLCRRAVGATSHDADLPSALVKAVRQRASLGLAAADDEVVGLGEDADRTCARISLALD